MSFTSARRRQVTAAGKVRAPGFLTWHLGTSYKEGAGSFGFVYTDEDYNLLMRRVVIAISLACKAFVRYVVRLPYPYTAGRSTYTRDLDLLQPEQTCHARDTCEDCGERRHVV